MANSLPDKPFDFGGAAVCTLHGFREPTSLSIVTLNEIDRDQLIAAARDAASRPLDHFPPLVTYCCLEDAATSLAAAAMAHLHSADPASSETLTMPRRGFGPRPVEILSPASRTLYSALVGNLDSALPEASRREGAWSEHREFGRQGDHEYVVELDFAACYELIDHGELQRELLLRSFDSTTVTALGHLLQGLGRHGRGLPQMLEASDRLQHLLRRKLAVPPLGDEERLEPGRRSHHGVALLQRRGGDGIAEGLQSQQRHLRSAGRDVVLSHVPDRAG